jgi:hypothetical protein
LSELSEKTAIREGQILTGPLFSEPMRVETIRADAADAWLPGWSACVRSSSAASR